MKKNILFQPYHFNPKLIEGIYAGCREFDLRLAICHPGMMKAIKLQSFDGLLSNQPDFIAKIRSQGGKAVCYSLLIDDSVRAEFDAAVVCDERMICELAADYFLHKGYWNFASSSFCEKTRSNSVIDTFVW